MKTVREVAKEIAQAFVRKSVFDMTNIELQQERTYAKQCALTCVDVIIQELRNTETMTLQEEAEKRDYFTQVKKEIEKL